MAGDTDREPRRQRGSVRTLGASPQRSSGLRFSIRGGARPREGSANRLRAHSKGLSRPARSVQFGDAQRCPGYVRKGEDRVWRSVPRLGSHPRSWVRRAPPRCARRRADAGDVRARRQGDRQSGALVLCRLRLVRDVAARRFSGLDRRSAVGASGARGRVRGPDLSRHARIAVDSGGCDVDGCGRVRDSVRGRGQLGARERDDGAAARVHPAGLTVGAGLVNPGSRRRVGPCGRGFAVGDLAAVAGAGAQPDSRPRDRCEPGARCTAPSRDRIRTERRLGGRSGGVPNRCGGGRRGDRGSASALLRDSVSADRVDD